MPFQKGIIPWNKGKKGVMPIPWNKGKRFAYAPHLKMRGKIPWNKNKEFPEFSGKNHFAWNGGKWIHSGYIMTKCPNHPFLNHYSGYVFEHRLIIEKIIKRYLKPKERVHHINGIKNDNRLENLMAFTNESNHQVFHNHPENIKTKDIIFDGRNFYP